MKTLGLSFDFHDSSAAFVADGKLVYAAAEERFTRQKHDSTFPLYSVRDGLKTLNWSIEDIDTVVFYEEPEIKFSRLLKTILKDWPFAPKEFISVLSNWLGQKLWVKNRIAKKLSIDPDKIHTIPHHLSHAYQAFVGSNLEQSAILIIDAVGEEATSSIYKACWKNGKPEFILLWKQDYPNSLGLFYSAMTNYLGFKSMNDECTTMALAAFGEPVYAELFRKILNLNRLKSNVQEGEDSKSSARREMNNDLEFHLDQEFFNFDQFYKPTCKDKLITILGPPRQPSHILNFSSYQLVEPTSDERRFANIAASVQLVTEEITLALAKKALCMAKTSNLCFAGGVALNCVANSKILFTSGCTNLFIPPEPGDGGASIGAAYWGYLQKETSHSEKSVYSPWMGSGGLGSSDSTDSDFQLSTDCSYLEEMISLINPQKLQKFRNPMVPYTFDVHWTCKRIHNQKKLSEFIADLIAEDKIIGWFQNRFEIGPRALGHRSILIRPDRIELANRLSSIVKSRAAFRPYALSMSREEAGQILELKDNSILDKTPFKWMQLAIPVRPEKQAAVRAGLHIDGTTRPQIVDGTSPKYLDLLRACKATLGSECLINTSFNEKDYPIVGSAIEALMMFARTSMDVLVLNNLVIEKKQFARELDKNSHKENKNEIT